MKRGGPLRRSTPLRAKQGLQRTGGPDRTPAAGSGRSSGRSGGLKRTGLKEIPADVAAEVRARSKGRCEAMADRRCSGQGDHLHHRAGRGEGRDRADLILDVCLVCHHEIHARPKRSYETGWMLSRLGPLPDFPADPPSGDPGRLGSKS